MLSLVAGGAIDEYILSQLKALRQEHQLARLIHSLQITLWPGGIWFQRLPERQVLPLSHICLLLRIAILLQSGCQNSSKTYYIVTYHGLSGLERQASHSSFKVAESIKCPEAPGVVGKL